MSKDNKRRFLDKLIENIVGVVLLIILICFMTLLLFFAHELNVVEKQNASLIKENVMLREIINEEVINEKSYDKASQQSN